MSIGTYITCDEPNCTARLRTGDRASAAEYGWRSTPRGWYDYCPDHAVIPSMRSKNLWLQQQWLARQRWLAGSRA